MGTAVIPHRIPGARTVPVPMAHCSFGGWRNPLFGDPHAHGSNGVHFSTRSEVVTTRWLDPSHGGVDLGLPRNA